MTTTPISGVFTNATLVGDRYASANASQNGRRFVSSQPFSTTLTRLLSHAPRKADLLIEWF